MLRVQPELIRTACEQLHNGLGGQGVGVVTFRQDAVSRAPPSTAAELFLREIDGLLEEQFPIFSHQGRMQFRAKRSHGFEGSSLEGRVN